MLLNFKKVKNLQKPLASLKAFGKKKKTFSLTLPGVPSNHFCRCRFDGFKGDPLFATWLWGKTSEDSNEKSKKKGQKNG